MHRITRSLMKMGKPRHSMSKSLAIFAIGAAVGAGISMWRDQKMTNTGYDAGDIGTEGPVEVDL